MEEIKNDDEEEKQGGIVMGGGARAGDDYLDQVRNEIAQQMNNY